MRVCRGTHTGEGGPGGGGGQVLATMEKTMIACDASPSECRRIEEANLDNMRMQTVKTQTR